MPTVVLPLTAESAPRRVRFTRSDVNRIQEAGLFEGRRFELIEGDLIDKMGQNPPHANALQIALEFLVRVFGLPRVRAQLPMDVALPDRNWNEPEPDLVVTAEQREVFRNRHPRGDETLLVLEIADSSIRQDLLGKRDLYARAGVPEYWVVNIQDRELVVHRTPHDGRYREILTLSEGAMVAPVCRPDAVVAVDALLL